MNLSLDYFINEINTHADYKKLNQAAWEQKIEYRDITHRSQKDFDCLIPMYVRKINTLRERLVGEWNFDVKVSDDGKALKSDAEILDAVKAKMDEWYYANQKEQRLFDKLAVCLKEVELREKDLVVRTNLHDQADYYIDYDNGNDGNDGLSTGNAWKTITKYTTDTVRTAGDRAFLRANITWDQGTEAKDITFDEDGTVDDYISIIGCDSVTNDPWSDGSDVKPIVDFEDAQYQALGLTDDFWWIERLDIRQWADTAGGWQVDRSLGWYFKDCSFSDSATYSALWVKTGGHATIDNCSFSDINHINGQLYISSGLILVKNCTFDAGSGLGSQIGIYCYAGTCYLLDCIFEPSNNFSTSCIQSQYGGVIWARNCSYNGTWDSFFGSYDYTGGTFTEDLDAVFESHRTLLPSGIITRETSSPRSGGADSYAKMLSSDQCGPNFPLILGDTLRGFSRIWASASVEITITVYARTGSAWDSALTASEAFLRASYLSNGASAARTEIDSTQTITNDAEWTAFSVTITPLRTGWVYLWFYLAEYEDASEYIDVDIKPVVS